MVKGKFSEEMRSCIASLYKSNEDIGKGRPRIRINENNAWELDEIIKRVSHQAFVTKRDKSSLLDLQAIVEEYEKARFANKLDELQMNDKRSAFVELIRVEENPRVKCWNSEVRNGKLYPPRMCIDLSNEDIEPGQAVRINTGIVIRAPFIAKTRIVDKGKIVVGDSMKQPDFVIIPLVNNFNNNSNNNNKDAVKFIVSCCPRDPDDTGLFTVNLTLVSGKLNKLQVAFNAYLTRRPLSSIFLIDAEPNAEIFKPKDSRSGRFVKNPKVKIHFDSLTREEDGSGVMKTFNSLVSPIATFEKQKVCIRGETVLFVNRKREWCNSSLICTPGIYNHKDGKRTIVPRVYQNNDDRPIDKNTHCLVFVESRLPLFSQFSTSLDNVLYLNGSFNDFANYQEAYRSMKQLTRGVRGLQQGYERCVMLKKRFDELDLDKMLRLYDYHRNIDDRLDELREKTALTDEAMFESQTVYSTPFSVSVKKAMHALYRIFASNDVTTTTTNDGGSGAGKRAASSGSNEDDEKNKKKPKTE